MRRGLVTALLVVPLQLLTAVPAAAADGEPVTGWWARTRLGPPVPVEAPAPVPEGGTWVASDPTGPLAVSALRLDLADGAVATGLSLTIDRADGTPAVRACPAVARWQAEQGGRLDTAPAHDCKVFVKAEVKGDALVVAFPAGFSEGFLDVVLTPEPGSTFSLTLQKATAGSVTTQAAVPAGGATGFEAAPPPPGVAPSGGSALPPLSTGVAAAPALPAAPAAPPLAAPAAPSTAPPVTAAPPAAAATRPVRADDRREAVPAAILFVLLGLFATYLAMQPAPPPRRLGGGTGLRQAPAAVVAPAAVRGVGRFRSSRSARPVRL